MKKFCIFTLQYNNYEKYKINYFIFSDDIIAYHRNDRLQL